MKAEMFSQQSKMLANRAEQSLAKALEIRANISNPSYYPLLKTELELLQAMDANFEKMEKLLYVAAEFNQQANEYLEMSAKELLLATAEL